MMRAALFSVCFLLMAFCHGQNLVPNPSFEEYTICPDSLSQIMHATGWSSFRGSCDYYNVCGAPDTAGVPFNWFGNQTPHSGASYAGIFCFSTDDGNPFDYREYLGHALSEPMVVGQQYYVAVHASLTTGGSGTNGSLIYASNRIGVLFTTQPFLQSDFDPVPEHAQVYGTQTITDSVGWQTIGGSFVADSAYQYVVVGNFFTDGETTFDSIVPNGTYGYSYYYIDDVCAASDPLSCVLFESVPKHTSNDILIYPNPFANTVRVTGLKDANVYSELRDMSGRLVVSGVLRSQGGSVQWSLDGLTSGAYMITLKRSDGSRITRLLEHSDTNP